MIIQISIYILKSFIITTLIISLYLFVSYKKIKKERMDLHLCDECGSKLRLSTGAGRFKTYRGESGYEVPEDLEFPACDQCGAEWLTREQIQQLNAEFEGRRKVRGIPTTKV